MQLKTKETGLFDENQLTIEVHRQLMELTSAGVYDILLKRDSYDEGNKDYISDSQNSGQGATSSDMVGGTDSMDVQCEDGEVGHEDETIQEAQDVVSCGTELSGGDIQFIEVTLS